MGPKSLSNVKTKRICNLLVLILGIYEFCQPSPVCEKTKCMQLKFKILIVQCKLLELKSFCRE